MQMAGMNFQIRSKTV
ncbi:MAG: hypothetical protein E7B11_11855 [Clostridiales bacterium]|nr:hypothetical protein [Clostridiales bacterium]